MSLDSKLSAIKWRLCLLIAVAFLQLNIVKAVRVAYYDDIAEEGPIFYRQTRAKETSFRNRGAGFSRDFYFRDSERGNRGYPYRKAFAENEKMWGDNRRRPNPNEEVATVELVTVILRHGHRTPDSLYPTYPNKNETFYPHGFGELTNQGKQREYQIGLALRKRYNNFLGQIVEPDTIVPRSSAIARAKRSLLLVLAGLFPPKGSQVWDMALNWQAIPTSYVPLPMDNVFFGAWCPKMDELQKINKETEEFKATYAKYADVLKYLSEKTGNEITNYQGVMRLFFDFKGMKDMGFELPEWSKKVFPRPMQDISIEMYKSLTANDEMIKYSAGFMMRKILLEMLQKVDGIAPKGRKMYLYSGHEINVSFMMILLNVFFDHAPPFGAYLVLELHKQNGEYGVKILYQDYEGPRMKVLIMPGCEEICPFLKFVALIQNRLPQMEDVCNSTTLEFKAE